MKGGGEKKKKLLWPLEAGYTVGFSVWAQMGKVCRWEADSLPFFD